MEIQPEIKEWRKGKGETKRDRDTGGARFPRNQAERLVGETGLRNWSILYFSGKLLYFKLYIEISG